MNGQLSNIHYEALEEICAKLELEIFEELEQEVVDGLAEKLSVRVLQEERKRGSKEGLIIAKGE